MSWEFRKFRCEDLVLAYYAALAPRLEMCRFVQPHTGRQIISMI